MRTVVDCASIYSDIESDYSTAHYYIVCGPCGKTAERHETGEGCTRVLLGFIGTLNANGV